MGGLFQVEVTTSSKVKVKQAPLLHAAKAEVLQSFKWNLMQGGEIKSTEREIKSESTC